MKHLQLLTVAILFSFQFYKSVAINVRFEQRDDSFREGRDIDSLFLQKEVTADSVTVRILPLSVSQFDEFQNATDRTFSEILELIDGIEFPATAGVDFNNAIIERVFLADETVLEVELSDQIIIDDNIKEPTEGFVMVLEVESNDPMVDLLEGFDAIRFDIFDNDEIMVGFDGTFFRFSEADGVITNTCRIITTNGTVSDQNFTVSITIFVDNSSSAATPDVDFQPVDGLYNYDLTVPPGQNSVFINPIAIFEDMVVEGDEFFFLAVAVVPQPGLSVQLNTMLATVVIIDNDRPVTVGGDPHYSIMLPSGQLLCFSVHGEKDFPFNLISNNLLQMNAFFIEDALREEITWIGSLGVVVQHAHYKKSNTTKIRFEAKDQMIYINNGVSLHAEKIKKLTLSNGKLTVSEAVRKDAEKRPEVDVDLADAGLAFSVRFVKKRHLDMSWKKVTKQSNDSHGIIGQFLREGVKIDEIRKLLYLPSLEPVPVMRSSVWHFMERESPDPEQKLCWQAMNPGYQGKRLIEGSYLDYLVDDVLSSDFQFKK